MPVQKVVPTPIGQSTKILIGTPVTVNDLCCIDERKCWEACTPALVQLGTFAPHWNVSERQLGLQGGQYLMGQFNQTWSKKQGKTLKQFQLEQDDESLVPFLEFTWGLQVSFCTSVARRVTLRELVADLLEVFANTFPLHYNLWEELKNNHKILEALKTTGFQK
jgi:hypothetical protein